MTAPPSDRRADPGLQPQRTALAWSRTALTLLVNALLVLRAGLLHDDRWMLVLAIVLGAASAALWSFGRWRQATLTRQDIRAAPAALMAITAGSGALAALASICSLLAGVP